MIRIYKMGEIAESEILARGSVMDFKKAEDTVSEIISAVRSRGDEAVKEYCKKFDGCELASLKVSADEIEKAYAETDAYFIETLEKAAKNIRAFHEKQRREGFEIVYPDGRILGQRILPVLRAGVYVPGGTAAYPSTVLMDVIPAVVAGVKEIAMVTPPDRQGNIKKEILAAAKVAGVTEIFKVGGAQAIAALAYGTESIKRVDKIVGPGNIFVATAKKAVSGEVGIDMFAGPSEILIIADKSANPKFLAADLLSQAEHDKLASAVLVCTDEKIAKETAKEVERQLELLPRKEIASVAIENNSKIIVVPTLEEAVRISDELAPEHLEIATENPMEVMRAVKNAGSIFLGSFTPEPLGDYFAGPNHTLPTSGTARFSSPLGVDDFIKRNSYLYYPREALADCADRVADFATREGLDAHARSITVRKGE
jgi:histidinol dehydrogenase